ncbi:MAG: class I SAM-dependent methyltransferase [Burkholderiales bacterium]|nr:class I SAM-dependent methyltransferase [Burkholderiales bacterium]
MTRAGVARWDTLSLTWHVEPPLAPAASDIAFYERLVASAAPRRALMLGATPAVAGMHWPPGLHLTATDWSGGMLGRVWPAQRAPADASRVRADWRSLPYEDSTFDVVVGDGCYSVFDRPEYIDLLNAEIARVLRPGGTFCIRCHRRPDELPSVDSVFADLLKGQPANLDLFRWKLATAVQGDTENGVRLGDVWDVWHRHVPDPHSIGRQFGWTDRAIANIEAWKDSQARYLFPSLRFLISEGQRRFSQVAVELPDYEWGEQFPRLTLTR